MATIELGGLRIPAGALAWKFVRAPGPGGQRVNKVSTAVECRLDLGCAEFAPAVRSRLERLAGSRLNARGEVVLFVAGHRSQARNRAAALSRLGDLIESARSESAPRIPTKPSLAQKAKRREQKKRRQETKQWRRPPELSGKQ